MPQAVAAPMKVWRKLWKSRRSALMPRLLSSAAGRAYEKIKIPLGPDRYQWGCCAMSLMLAWEQVLVASAQTPCCFDKVFSDFNDVQSDGADGGT